MQIKYKQFTSYFQGQISSRFIKIKPGPWKLVWYKIEIPGKNKWPRSGDSFYKFARIQWNCCDPDQ